MIWRESLSRKRSFDSLTPKPDLYHSLKAPFFDSALVRKNPSDKVDSSFGIRHKSSPSFFPLQSYIDKP